MDPNQPDPLALDAARFLVASLSLDVDPGEMATGLDRIDRDDRTSVYAVQLGSSVGPAAFLVYAYATTGDQAAEARSRFEGDIRTLQQAQERDVPGPRLVASGELDGTSYILATDPATFAALAGGEAAPPPAPAMDPAEAARTRRRSAERLLRSLKDADREASRWLAALPHDDAGSLDLAGVKLDDAETELALFLLGPDGIRNVLRMASLLIEQGKAAAARPAAAPPPIRPGVDGPTDR
jgi:hypothetical protein